MNRFNRALTGSASLVALSSESWHSYTQDELFRRLGTTEDGLTDDEARERLSQFGPNRIEEAKRRGPLRMFLEQFTNPMVVILLIAVAVSLVIFSIHGSHEEEAPIDAIVILAILMLNAVFGFVQEYKSEKALESLKELAAPRARVRRNGRWQEVDSADIVPGDLVAFESGDRIPADARLISAVGLSVDESAFTGESVPVGKSTEPIPTERPPLGDMVNMVFQSTIVTSGKGTALVTTTGMSTEFGRIATLVQETKKEMTPLQHDLADLGRRLGILVVCLSVLIFFTEVFIIVYQDWTESLFVAVALAVAAVPEGLPAVVTVTLAIGVQRMVKKNAVVRRLPSVETLGSVTIICSDKTGTITKNEMTVRQVYVNRTMYAVTGSGYNNAGAFYLTQEQHECEAITSGERVSSPSEDPHLARLFEICQLCNNAVLEPDSSVQGAWKLVGDPTEGALLVLAEKGGLARASAIGKHEQVTEIEFTSERKRMTSIVRTNTGVMLALTKGAPEALIPYSDRILEAGIERPMNAADKERLMAVSNGMAACAMRVLGFAYRRLDDYSSSMSPEEVERELVFVGLVGMMDPPRDEVYEAVRKCRRAGIRPIMITGDHELTAQAIAGRVGLADDNASVIGGSRIQSMTDEALKEAVHSTSVFARVAPEHKLRIVGALKARGHVVAMTGDGVNDAPAIKSADVGVAMGIRGADVTKESSDLVLLDDNFATIVAAIETGREVYANIRKFVRFLLSTNTGEVVFVFAMIILGLPIPLLPVQILWINLVTDGLPALALGVDPPERGIMDRPPRRPGQRILDAGMVKLIALGGFLGALITAAIFLGSIWSQVGYVPGITGPAMDWSLAASQPVVERARTNAFIALVIYQLAFIWNCRDEYNPVWKTHIRGSKHLIAAVLFSLSLSVSVVVFPPLQFALGTVALSAMEWLAIAALTSLGLLVPAYKVFGHHRGGTGVEQSDTD
ncbi:MAG: cation-translocating P-type ATPase [Candidatus Thorarchaeota archaeon]|nr:cation-translocating P-type ATPase [Candidatus Thorarchaeota archaeon]